MFCDKCGTSISGNDAYCPSCGKPVRTPQAGPPPVVQAPVSRVSGHVKLLGIFWIIYSVLQLSGGWFFSSVMPRIFHNIAWNMDFGFAPHVPMFLGSVLRAAGWVLMVRGVLGIIAGWGLLSHEPWARMLAIVLAFFNLLHPLLGTALGIYTLWVLMPGESEREYRQMAGTA
jgi:hypothetical protein